MLGTWIAFRLLVHPFATGGKGSLVARVVLKGTDCRFVSSSRWHQINALWQRKALQQEPDD